MDFIPRKKFYLGIPLYCRHWSGKSVSEGPYEEALKWAAQWRVRIEADADQKEKVVRFADGQDSHVVWLLDAQNVQERMELAVRYRLAGFSAWRLGQEDPVVWNGTFSQASGKHR